MDETLRSPRSPTAATTAPRTAPRTAIRLATRLAPICAIAVLAASTFAWSQPAVDPTAATTSTAESDAAALAAQGLAARLLRFVPTDPRVADSDGTVQSDRSLSVERLLEFVPVGARAIDSDGTMQSERLQAAERLLEFVPVDARVADSDGTVQPDAPARRDLARVPANAMQVGLTSVAQPLQRVAADFRRIPADTEMSTGQSVAVECQHPDADLPYRPYDWPLAQATLELEQGASWTRVAIEVEAARPDTYYTVWLRLKGTDAEGAPFGGSPLTGAPGTALVPGSELGAALAATAPGSGSNDLSNGFWTDDRGNASFVVELDFPLLGGAYPFHRLADFDPHDARLPLESPSNHPVAIVDSGAPFTLRIASHCTDGVGHGLLPGPHEGWFDWIPTSER